MADDAPQPPKSPRPAKKAAVPMAGPKPRKPKGQTMDDTVIDNPIPQTGATSGTTTPPGDDAAVRTTDTASATIQSLKDSATTITKNVGEKAKAYAEDNKARAHGALDELVKMINDAAGTVDEKVGAQYGQYARTAADTVSGFSESLKAKNVDDLIADATSFVKKSPAVAIGTAAAIGFVLIRLAQSGLNADTADRS